MLEVTICSKNWNSPKPIQDKQLPLVSREPNLINRLHPQND